ncbi:hypothetical protein CHS0354_005964 [Potamilus streckersoni]|uniref:Afadin n=1 Tax=Potamilus streckersoni TaxID=2493646 RepID=A0AAE0VGD7_9BIVA|nr:hypothetical protein CHS0354_005964 [Potamilus streckersoni]
MTETERIQDRNKLAQLIQQWNQDHYDLFELSAPNEAGEFHGVVRFYFQDQDKNVVTKCIRVASSATTRDVVEILMEKFRPDMRMLTESKYSLYEVHVNGEERKLFDDERPLYVQLSWGKDVREGRFLLKRDGQHVEAEPQNFKRKLSKREKKEKRKQEKERKLNKENKENVQSVAEKLYNEVPDTSFTRSISNPEAVMRRRRQQKIEKKWAQFSKQNGQGGTLKIYGETLRPDVPYKTLLLSSTDTVKHVIKEAMEKYDMNDAEPDDFCLVQVLVPPGEREYHGGPIGEETVLKDEDCPLAIAMKHPPSRGVLIFQLKRRNADMIKPKYKRQRAVSHDDLRYTQDQPSTPPNKLPFLVEFNPDGTENPKGKVHRLHLDVTEVGSEKSMSMSTSGQYLQLHGPNIQPRHCVIAHTGGIVTVTPTSRESEVYVNNQRIFETTLLQHSMIVRFGKMNAFRFIDPAFEEKQKKVDHMDSSMAMPYSAPGRAPETNFDMDGHVETVTGGPHPQRQDSRPSVQESSQKSSPRDMVRGDVGRGDIPKNYEELLPAALEFRDDKENEFLRAIILEANPSATQFKLSPTYTLYMAVRFCLSNMYQPDISPTDRAHKLTSLVNKIADMANQTIQDNRDNPASLAFWMANASEILHFLKQDHDIHPFSQESQEILAEGVQMAFHHLVRCLQYDLQRTMPAFLDESDSVDEDESRVRYNRNKPALSDVLDTLSSAMNLLRRCRVNAALTIQLFSQLFHFVNMWLFNTLIIEKRLQLCTRAWGIRLKRRLGRIEAWAEKQGLELAADCHLCRIIQAAHLLEAPKSNPDDIANISSTCFKLNSLQLRELLQSYIPELGEPPIPMNLVDRIVSVAQNMADDLIRAEGREVQLQEDPDLQLPFLLPEDGYSCDTIRGIPNGLGEFIEPAARAGLCRMTPQPQAPGVWTVYMVEEEGSVINETLRKERPTPEPRPQPSLPKEPEIVTVAFNKVKGSMGLSIVAAKGDGQRERGIYIKSVVPGGAAALDGRLQAGDQLLEVDGKSLVGLTQEKAAELMTKTGQTVTLKVAKQGAIYHGLATLLSQPSPVMPRATNQKAGSPGIQPTTPSKQRPNEEGPPPYTGGNLENDRLRPNMPMQKQDVRSLPRDHPGLDKSRQSLRGPDSRSSPALNTPQIAQGFRAPPNGNLREPSGMQNQPISNRPQQGIRRENHELDKAKSIPNLRMDISYDGPVEGYHQMRPAMSVGALQQQGNPNHDYYNQVPQTMDKRDMIDKSHDYENHPSVDPRLRQQEPLRDNRSQPSPGQSMPPQFAPSIQVAKPVQQQLQPADRIPQTSRPSGNFRDERPQSAYFGQQDRPDSLGSRPKSAEINPDWQDRFGQGGFPGQQAPGLDRSFENRNGPNYSNIRPQPNYANQGEIQKLDINNQERQLNFYENTVPRQQSLTPPFQQLRRPPSEEKPRPYLAPKPKPNQPVIQPAEIPRTEVDHRQTQPHFYDVRIAQERLVQAPASQGFSVAPHQQAPPQQAPPQQSHYQNTGFQDPRLGARGKFSPGHDKYNQFQGSGIPPPPSDVPPELPPPPKMEDLRDDELPPLPPPPVMDYRLEQQIRNEQNRIMQMDPDYSMHQPDHSYSNLPPQGYDPYNKFPNQISPHSIPNSHADYADRNTYPPNYHDSLRQPSIQPAQTQIPLNPSHDYQNIEYPRSANRSFETQKQLSTGHNQQNLYETYDPRVQPQQQPQPQKPIERLSLHKAIKDQREVVVSPWDRDAKEKAQKDQEDTIARLRQSEISDLESKPYLTPQEQERLRKLKIEQEFQKRVQEVSAKDDEDEDSDDDRFISRDRSLQSLQEDLVKARLRMNELEEKHLYQELEREKERTNRLERRIEMFEKEREEQKARLQKRQERQQKENEEYLRKQREAREKQRLQFEENKRLLMQEEEKMNQRKMEEMQKRKEMEKKRLEEIQAQKEAEEAKAREEIRRQEEEYARQQLERQERERREQQREIRVNEERKRLEAMAAQNQNSQYNYQYANLPPQPAPVSMLDSRYMQNTSAMNSYAPPPPERGSSYSVANQRSISTSNIRPEAQTDSKIRSLNSATSGRGSTENIPTKKSVSFNTEVQTRESEPRSPTYPPYSSSQPVGVGLNRNFEKPGNNSLANHNNIPQSPIKNNMNDVQYKTAENTPSVIGAQEVYRDPRARIEAKMANQGKNMGSDRMSFRDKMKYFAAEAGETTPQGRTRASKAQRAIESQLQNGQ